VIYSGVNCDFFNSRLLLPYFNTPDNRSIVLTCFLGYGLPAMWVSLKPSFVMVNLALMVE
jgi:hypothetical protein